MFDFLFNSNSRMAKTLVQYEESGGTLMGEECFFLAAYYNTKRNSERALDYISKGARMHCLTCMENRYNTFASLFDKESNNPEFLNEMIDTAMYTGSGSICLDYAQKLISIAETDSHLNIIKKLLNLAVLDGQTLAAYILYDLSKAAEGKLSTAKYWLVIGCGLAMNKGEDSSKFEDLLAEIIADDEVDNYDLIIQRAADEGCTHACITYCLKVAPTANYMKTALDGQDRRALLGMGKQMINGNGKDIETGMDYLETAAHMGCKDAVDILVDICTHGRQYDNGTYILPDQAKALYYAEFGTYHDRKFYIKYCAEHTSGIHQDFFNFMQ